MLIRTRLLFLVGIGFVLASAIVVYVADRWMIARIKVSQEQLFLERLDSIVNVLERKNTLLEQTGLVEAYRVSFQNETIKQLSAKYYSSAEIVSYPFIIDSRGCIILHPKRAVGDESLAREDFIQQLISSGEGSLNYTFEGATKWCLYHTFKPWGWTVCYTIPLKTLYADVHHFRMTFLTVMSVTSLGVLVMLFIVVSFMTRPIRQLTNAAIAMSAGNLEQTIEISTRDEIGILGTSFNTMSNVIREKIYSLDHEVAERRQAQDQLAQLNKTLEMRVEERTKELQKSNEELATARHIAEAASKSKSEFLANMSHEIRTPMNAIVGFGEMLAEDNQLSPEHKEYANIICVASRNLLTIINDILDFSKIEAGKLKIEIIDCSVSEMINNLDMLLRQSAQNKGLVFEILRCDNLPEIIKTDPVRVRQCLINLVNNAIKFTEQGHVSIGISIVTAGESNQQCIRFDVTDTGIGMQPEQLGNIFEAFTQADSSTTRKYGGTGLGLTITRQITKLLGGTITVSSVPAKGSIFSLTIPTNVGLTNQQAINPNELIHHISGEQDADKPVTFDADVLVAEDASANQVLIKKLLTKLGIRVIIAGNGQIAVNIARERKFDLIFMDMQMPIMNGYDAAAKIRSVDSDIPIIALTASAMLGDADKCFTAGCNEYLSKPIDRKRLVQILRQYIPTQKQTAVSDDLVQFIA